MRIAAFNDAARESAIATIQPCLDIPRWFMAIVDGRPFADLDAVLHRARHAAEPFTEAEIDGALAHHPRIGERAHGSGAEARFSTAEQAGLGAASPAVEAALRQGNHDYENRFGRVFLIRAAGRDRAEILAELGRRLRNDPAHETREVALQLREIAVVRLQALFGV
ncbi:MAG TPA: 2-oxo-4-hydroxy-4-carboxy-5-ureidoimidazoline decarboxylase [Rhodanobacteraceae bacterium]|nr:2-oxo-4-hydroxy-4-carboxy-5-ureidoimidazoline decarboxylase [Rhodanobacteraceae bacterium]